MANKTSKSNENYFARYKTLGMRAKNKKLRLERELRRNPNNKNVEMALASIVSYGRKAPTTPKWTPTAISTAVLLRAFKKANKPVPQMPRAPFSIGVRAHDGRGNAAF